MEKTINISVHGTWFTVPAIECNETTLAVTGKWLKIATVHDEDYQERELRSPEACVERLKQHAGARADIFTFRQKPPASAPRYTYPMEWESVAAVRTTSFKAWWDQLPQEGRKNVRRAEKRGVQVLVKALDDKLVSDILDLNNDSPVRQGRAFVHYGKNLEQVRADQQSFLERSDYICAYFEGQLIGFLKVAYQGDLAGIVQILPRASHHDKRPANALLAKAIEVCEAKGVTYLTYGLFNYGNRRDSPLRQFKVRNGFEEILVPRYYVPLTIWGAVAIKLKLYRGMIGILPDGITRLAAKARAIWYGLRRPLQRPV